jgi:hypothetical protein
MKYQPIGKRNPRRPLKKLLGCYIETGKGRKTYVSESILIIIMMKSGATSQFSEAMAGNIKRCTRNGR